MEKETKKYFIIEKYKQALDKSYEDIAIENAVDALEDTIIECEAQISNCETSRIPAAENALKRAERDLVKAQKLLEDAKYPVITNLANYISGKTAAQAVVNKAKAKVSATKADLEYEKECLEEFKVIYADLTKIAE